MRVERVGCYVGRFAERTQFRGFLLLVGEGREETGARSGRAGRGSRGEIAKRTQFLSFRFGCRELGTQAGRVGLGVGRFAERTQFCAFSFALTYFCRKSGGISGPRIFRLHDNRALAVTIR